MIEKLPFFSLLNLGQRTQYLSEHGFKVRVKKIKRVKMTDELTRDGGITNIY